MGPILVLLGWTFAQQVASVPTARLAHGEITYYGTKVGPVEYFQNIKFAHDTSGPRRFAPPVPYIPPAGAEIDASTQGSACPQTRDAMPPFFGETTKMDEDCLNLRIARHEGTTPGDKLPVVIWVHGGGVVKGSAYDPHFEPDNLIKLSHQMKGPIIFVALNYRLTIFGFARSPLLKTERSLNVGMRDQRAGFQWVKDHIADFGGDPDRITVFGLSAGGTFASLHLMAFGGEQGVPFNQVWSMSGPPGTALNMTSTITEYHTKTVASMVGCSDDSERENLECLRAVPMEALLATAMQHSVSNHPPAGLFTFIPSVDDDMFPESPSKLYRAGRFVKDIPMILGWTQDDGAMNAGPAHLITGEEAMRDAIQGFASQMDDEQFDALFNLYSATDFAWRAKQYEVSREAEAPQVPIHYFRLSQILRDMLFTCSSIDFGFEMTKQSQGIGRMHSGARIYALNQSMLTPLWRSAGMPYVSVSHGSDTNYIFNGVFPEGEISKADHELSTSLAEAFIRFATTGDPNSGGLNSDQLWQEAFPIAPSKLNPEAFHLHIFGGSLGTGDAFVTTAQSENRENDVLWEQNAMDPLHGVEGLRTGAMGSDAVLQRSQVIAFEKLTERCLFLNGLSETLGN